MPSDHYYATIKKTCEKSGSFNCKNIPFGKIYTKGFVIDLDRTFTLQYGDMTLDDIVRIIDDYLYSKNNRILRVQQKS